MTAEFRAIDGARDCADAVRLICETATTAGAGDAAALAVAENLVARVGSGTRDDLAWMARDAEGALAVFLADLETLSPDDSAHTYRAPRRLASPLFGFCARRGLERAAVQHLVASLRRGSTDADLLVSIEIAATAHDLGAALESIGMHQNALLCHAETAAVLAGSRRPPTAPVRRATTADLSQVAALAMQESRYQATETGSGTSVDQVPGTFERVSQEWLSDPDAAVFLIPADAGDAVAMIVVEASTDEPDPTADPLLDVPHGYIALLFVTAHARGGGLGDALVGAAAAWASGRGLRRLGLHYIADNPLSAPFWTRRGFDPVTVEYLGTVESVTRGAATHQAARAAFDQAAR